MRKVKPPLLKPGDKIGVISPARFVSPSEIEGGLDWIKRMGFVPVLGRHVYDRYNQFAGTDEDRSADILAFLDNPEIKCIWSTRGGYGSIRMMPLLSKAKTSANPKWFIGYSDFTVLHSWLNEKFHIQSIHGPMLFSWDESIETKESFEALGRMLMSGNIEYQYNIHKLNHGEKMKGVLCGGNMSMLLSMRGTDLDLDVSGKILFIEDIDEYLYHIDRMMYNFRLSGWLEKVAGILVGGMTDMNDNDIPFGQGAENIISSVCNEYGLPIIFGHPAGHLKRNMPLVFGEEINIYTRDNKVFCNQ